MKKKAKMILGVLCYCLGVFFGIYVGGWLFLIEPINALIAAYNTDNISFQLLIGSIIKIALSTTVAGLVWCIGYIGYNHFKGTEDPDWRALEAKWKERRDGNDN